MGFGGIGRSIIMHLPTGVSRKAGAVMLKASRYSPHIFTGIGIVTGIAAAVEAARSTPRFVEALEEHNRLLEQQKEYEEKIASGEIKDEYTPKQKRDDRISVYVKTFVEFIKTYGKAIALETISLLSFMKALKILNGRYLGAAAALVARTRELNHLEERVVDEYGEDRLRELKGPGKSETTVEGHVDEKTGETVVDAVSYENHSSFSKIFDESNPNWEKDPALNRNFLQCVQNYANDLLKQKGHLFLNEVLVMLGYEPTQAGQVMGWALYDDKVKMNAHGAKGYVDIGIFNTSNPRAVEFINGNERSIWLEFNVDKDPILANCGMAVS